MQAGRKPVSPYESQGLHELKKKAQKYYQENGVPQKVEEVLNSMFYDDPKDVYGHLADYFGAFATPPVISKLKARTLLNGRGQPVVEAELYVSMRNREELMACSLSGGESILSPDLASPEEKDTLDEEKRNSVSDAVDFINSHFSDAIASLDPDKQKEVDAILSDYFAALKREAEEKEASERELDTPMASESLKESDTGKAKQSRTKSPKGGKGAAKSTVVIIPDEPKETFISGMAAISAVSQTMCKSGAAIRGIPLYKYIAALRHEEPPEEFRLPQLIVTILASGKVAPGKQNCVKEYMVIPRADMSLMESLKNINAIYEHCAKSLSKAGVQGRYVNEMGALCPVLEKPEQGLDMLQEAVTALELTAGEDFFFAINCAGHEIFDYEKGRYEVIQGQLKLPEELAEFWLDILRRYPALILMIDPIRRVEREAWMKLAEKVSEHCYVCGDVVYRSPAYLRTEELTPQFQSSAICLRMEHMMSVTDLVEVTKKMEEASNAIVMSSSQPDTTETMIADLAVGLNARFLRLGAPCQGERTAKLNRLLQIDDQLQKDNMLATWPMENNFPTLKAPTPEPSADTPEVQPPTSAKKK